MAPQPSEEQLADLNVTHAFINILRACYQGMYAYENAYGQLARTADRELKMKHTSQVLDKIGEWWQQFGEFTPLMRFGDKPNLAGDAARAWKLLGVVQARLESLAGELLESGDVDTLLENPPSRYIRVAAFVEAAYARQYFINGLVSYGEVLGREDVADRWRQHTLYTQQDVAQATRLFADFQKMGDSIDGKALGELLDVTLTQPVVVGRQIVDIREVFGLYTGKFDFTDAGIPADEIADWSEPGFSPAEAAHWRASGMHADEALAWIKAGVPDSLGAAMFAWRGVAKEVAGKWFVAGHNGRSAAAWIEQGIEDPNEIPREA